MTPLGPDRAALLARGWLLAVDPGVEHPAAAAFRDGELVAASRVKLPGAWSQMQGFDTGERCRRIADIVVAWARALWPAPFAHLVYEKPKVYGVGKSKGNPEDMIKLALVCGGVANGLGAVTISVEPGEWAVGSKTDARGKLYKDPWSSPRGQIIWSRLRDHERGRIQVTNDAIDSTGVGLWALGRLGRVFPGSV